SDSAPALQYCDHTVIVPRIRDEAYIPTLQRICHDEEIDALIAAYQRIKPREVMLYSIDRSTPEEKLQKVEIDELRVIAARIEQAGIKVQVN
ncbi:MAG: hypothetical protein UHE93_06555, partial [Muribaculaceae bacterium]|nr:hypothetical protein [Muribaculaceae bacterium]